LIQYVTGHFLLTIAPILLKIKIEFIFDSQRNHVDSSGSLVRTGKQEICMNA
jgi:hypothetical protein